MMILVVLAIILSAELAKSQLIFESTHIGKINDIHCESLRGKYVSIRVLKKNGEVEPSALENAKIFSNQGRWVSYHATPCVKCGNVTKQGIELCEKLLQPALHIKSLIQVYIDATDPLAWSRNIRENVLAIREFATMIDGCGIDHAYYSPAIFTNKTSWETITGSHSGFSCMPLWYMNLDGRMDHSNFVPFGGWQKPSGKMHHLIGRDGCGNEDVMLGFW